MQIKSILVLILIASIMINPASAGLPDVDVAKILPDVIAKGFDSILINLGNQLYSSIGATNSTNATQILSRTFITPNTFLSDPSLQAAKDFNAFWFGLFYVIFLLLGGIFVIKEHAMPETGFVSEKSFGNKYLEIAIGGILVYLFYLYGLDILFRFESVLSYGITLQAMNMIIGIPASPFLYLLLSIMFFIINCFFLLRYLFLVILASYFLLLVAMSKIPVINGIIYVLFLYGITFLFIRPIIALILLAGSGAVASIPIGWYVDILAYTMLLLIVIITTVLVMIAPFLYLYLRSITTIKIMRMK